MPRRARAVIILKAGLAAIAATGSSRADQDGSALFRNQCSVCHTIAASDPPRIGPSLRGVYGRRAGSAPGFRYSTGLTKAGFAWDDERLDAWLTNPQSVVPTTTMLYRVSSPGSRQALIEWLKQLR